MALYALGEDEPHCDPTAWIAPSASVIGRTTLAAKVNVWFGAVIRGDNELITVGAGTNIQDMAMLHSDWGFPLTVGAQCTIGHGAIIHGCTIGEGSLVGMGATVLNGVKIGRGCIIGANALVPENREIPDFSLVIGMPAKVVKTLDDATVADLKDQAKHYVENAEAYAKGLKPLDGQSG